MSDAPQKLNPEQERNATLNAADALRTETVNAMIDLAQKNFATIDKDKNGFLTPQEINQFAATKAGQDRKLADGLEKSVGKIQNQSNDEWGWENDGITKNDLAELKKSADQMAPAMAQARAVQEMLSRNFRLIDTTANGRIHRYEVEAAVKNPGLSANDAKLMHYTLDNFSTIGRKMGKSSRRITPADVENYPGRVEYRYSDIKSIADSVKK